MLTLADLVRALHANQRMIAWTVAIPGLLGVVFAGYLAANGELRSSDGPTIVGGIAVTGVVLAGLGLWWWSARRVPEKTGLYRQLTEARNSLVWIHRTDFGASRALYFLFTEDRKMFGMPVQSPGLMRYRADQIEECLAKEFPCATLGFSPELQEKYRADPKSLRRSS